MGELVERLRNPPFADRIHMADLHTEAADRIEALEAALRVIANPDWTWATVADMREHARAALEEAGNGRG